MKKIILHDLIAKQQLDADSLLRTATSYDEIGLSLAKYENLTELIIQIIRTIFHQSNLQLLDTDLSQNEKKSLLIDSEIFEASQNIPYSFDAFPDGSSFTLYTSGTTGLPKKVTQTFSNLKRTLKVSHKHRNDVWALAFNPTHMAGLQVILQALLNQNTLINVFGLEPNLIPKAINEYEVTHISATPTFYRLLPTNDCCNTVKKVSCGGEKLDSALLDKLKFLFPNAQVMNIYASTEAGSVLVSSGQNFQVKPEVAGFVAVFENELHLHKDILGSFGSEVQLREGLWYPTSDLVEIVCEDPLTIRFTHRKNEMINVGGYKVNPQEVEECILGYPGVKVCKVYGKKNSVLGNILLCDVVFTEKNDFSEPDLRQWLEKRLQSFKIPRIFQVVDNLNVTNTGKLERK
jgi:acyl-CoA synthetase (AMP-forming)/AMP-acid ligase II